VSAASTEYSLYPTVPDENAEKAPRPLVIGTGKVTMKSPTPRRLGVGKKEEEPDDFGF
jgi:hypothetical protein